MGLWAAGAVRSTLSSGGKNDESRKLSKPNAGSNLSGVIWNHVEKRYILGFGRCSLNARKYQEFSF
jgi:hypothetical protein